MLPRFNKTQWTVVDTQTNATVTATKAALANHRHYVAGFSISVRGTTPAVGTVELRSAANVKDRYELPAAQFPPMVVDFNHPIECNINEAATLTLLAGMGATQTCTLVIKGFTIAE